MTRANQLAPDLAAPAHRPGRDLDLAHAALVDAQIRAEHEAFRAARAPRICRCDRPLLGDEGWCAKCGRGVRCG
jgi:hypothetical protein